jgi:hypothetical protein
MSMVSSQEGPNILNTLKKGATGILTTDDAAVDATCARSKSNKSNPRLREYTEVFVILDSLQ